MAQVQSSVRHRAWRPTRRSVIGAGLAVAASLAISACGAQGGEGKPATASVNASGTVKYFNWGNAFSDGIENKVLDAFHAKQSKIKIEFTNSVSDHFTKLQAALAGGDPPDTALVDGYDIRALIKAGGAHDLTTRMQRDGVKKDDYVTEWFDEFLYKGKYYNHPNMRGSTASYYYNKSILDKAGIKVPAEGWTFNDLLDIAQKTTRDASGRTPTQGGFDPAGATFGFNRPSYWWCWMWANGADLIDMDKNVCTLDSPAALETFQFISDMQNKHKVLRESFPGVPGASDLFAQGKLAIRYEWFTDVPRFRSEINNFEWDVAVSPQGKTKKQMGIYKGNGEVLPTGAKNPDAAWEFMKFLGGYDAMLIYGVEGRFVPALKKANQAPEFLKSGKPPKNVTAFTDGRIKTLPLMPEWNAFNRDIWNPLLNKIWNNEAPVKDVATDISRQTTDFIKNREKY